MARKLVNLKVGSDVLVPKVVVGVDMQNQLALYNQVSFDYTATQDCVIATNNNNTSQCSVDGVVFQTSYGTPSVWDWFFLKQGQNIRSTYEASNAKCSLKVYGVKF